MKLPYNGKNHLWQLAHIKYITFQIMNRAQ